MSNAAPGEASTLQEDAAHAARQAGLRHVCDGEPGTRRQDAAAAAGEAGVRHVGDGEPGIARRRAGPHFAYVMPDGATVTDEAVLERIRALAIPPAWTEVWICRTRNGHLQATGRDARGRKQYRYHGDWQEVRGNGKF